MVAKATDENSSSITADGISVTLTLNTTHQVAGQPIDATYVVVNRTGQAIYSSAGECGGPGIVIDNSHVRQLFFSDLMICAPRLLFPTGRSVTKVKILTTYLDGPGTGLPALPLGTYATKILWGDQPAPVPDPRPIKVVLGAPLSNSLN
jgi:hypothetical protein